MSEEEEQIQLISYLRQLQLHQEMELNLNSLSNVSEERESKYEQSSLHHTNLNHKYSNSNFLNLVSEHQYILSDLDAIERLQNK